MIGDVPDEDIEKYVQELKVSYWYIRLRYFPLPSWQYDFYQHDYYDEDYYQHGVYARLFVPVPRKPDKLSREHWLAQKVAWVAASVGIITRDELPYVEYVFNITKDEYDGPVDTRYEPDERLSWAA